MNQIEVQIMQQSYRLACPEGQQERLLQAVGRVDAAMTRIRDAGKVRARERIAVLAALNLAFELADQEERAAAPESADAGALSGSEPAAPPAPQELQEAQPLQDMAPASAPMAAGGPATEPVRHDLSAGDPSAGDALEALLRRLDHALGDERRPA